MIIYNVTLKIEASITDEWLTWLKDEHIPDVINTGCFTNAVILKLIDIDETDGPTYAVQYSCESKAAYNRYIELHAPEMRRRSFEKWGDKFIAFRSIMQVVN